MLRYENLSYVPGLPVPESLDSAVAGVLTLYCGQLRDDSGAVVMRVYRYEGKIEDGANSLAVSFHPPADGSHLEDWIKFFDARIDQLRHDWRPFLLRSPHRLRRLLWAYGHLVIRMKPIIKTMRLGRIKVVWGKDDELNVCPIEPFESLDISITIDKKNRVTSASFGG